MNLIVSRLTRRYLRNFMRCVLVYATCLFSMWNVATAKEGAGNYQRFTILFDSGFKISAKTLGPMIEDDVRKEQNQYMNSSEPMLITRRYYNGVLQTFYDDSDNPNEIEVNSQRIELPFNIRIGIKKEKVLSVMGPAEFKDNKLLYEHSAERIEFKFENEKLSSIHWVIIGW